MQDPDHPAQMGIELGSVAEILHALTAGNPIEGGTRILRSPLFGVLPDPFELPAAEADDESPYVIVRADDLVGDPRLRDWHQLPTSYEGVAADASLTVIRMRPGSGVPSGQVLVDLRTRQPVPEATSLTLAALEDIRDHVIRAPGPYADGNTAVFADIAGGLDALASLGHDLRNRSNAALDPMTRRDLDEPLRRAADLGRLVSQSVRHQMDPLHQVTQLYPYSIARPVRRYLAALEPTRRYVLLLRAAECLVITLGEIALASFRDAHGGVEQATAWWAGISGRGLTFGHWHDLIRPLADANRGEPGLLGRVSRAVVNKKSGLTPDLERLLAERNRSAHNRGPQTDAEYEQALLELGPLFRTILERCSFLVSAPWVLPDHATFRKATKDFVVVAWRAMGDHPDLERYEFRWPEPLAENLYVLDFDAVRAIDLEPFARIDDCPQCRAREMYYPDSMTSDGAANLLSFDRGHTVVSSSVGESLLQLRWGPATLVDQNGTDDSPVAGLGWGSGNDQT